MLKVRVRLVGRGVAHLMPLMSGGGLAWSLDAVRARFPALPGFVLSGAFVAIVYRWLGALAQALFPDDVGAHDEEGIGIRGLRALARGAFAGMIGGLVFTVIMVRIGVLPTVARLVGASSPWTGFIVHLVIANLIGASFGLLFLRRSFDLGSALGWGISYGFFWWILGPLTLLPVLLGVTPRWTPEVAGVTFHLLEARYNPWWVSHTNAAAMRSARRRDQVLTSAPALWALVVVIALTLPVVLSCGMPQTGSGYSMTPQGRGYETAGPYAPRSTTGDSGGYGPAPSSSPSATRPYAPAPFSPGYEQPSGRRDTCQENGSAPKAPY